MTNEADDANFEVFAQGIRRWLRYEAYIVCGDWHEADDLVQMALWKIYRRWSHLRRTAELRAYARQVVVSIFLTERRRSRWKHEIMTETIVDYGQLTDSHRAFEDRSLLLTAMLQLGARQRAVVSLRFVRDLSVEQTARALGCTPSTVTSQTVRALATLRRALQ
ncbi:sigma-70 family RNA polymerase sigma factor [Micromonospora sp. NPDC004704]